MDVAGQSARKGDVTLRPPRTVTTIAWHGKTCGWHQKGPLFGVAHRILSINQTARQISPLSISPIRLEKSLKSSMETPIRSSQFLLPNHVETSRRTSAHLPSGKLPHNYGKIHHFQWLNPLHISMVIFNSYVSHYQRVFPPLLWWLSAVPRSFATVVPVGWRWWRCCNLESFLKIRHHLAVMIGDSKKKMQIQQPFDGDLMVLARL